jgi:hypothetical protein
MGLAAPTAVAVTPVTQAVMAVATVVDAAEVAAGVAISAWRRDEKPTKKPPEGGFLMIAMFLIAACAYSTRAGGQFDAQKTAMAGVVPLNLQFKPAFVLPLRIKDWFNVISSN